MAERMIKPNEGTHVDSAVVEVAAPQIRVEAPQITASLDINHPFARVEAPQVHVSAPRVILESISFTINLPQIPAQFLWVSGGALLLIPLTILLSLLL